MNAPKFLIACLVALVALPVAQAAAGNFDDQFASAENEFSGKDWWQGVPWSTKSATKEVGEPEHAGYPGGHSVWIPWTSYENQTVEIRACGSADVLLGVYTGTSVGALTEVASNDENALGGVCPAPGAAVRFAATANTKYMVAVDSKATTGQGHLTIRTLAANDDFADAEVLAALPAFVHVDNRIATKETGEPSHAGYTGGHTVWYEWTAPKSDLLSLSTCTGEHSGTAIAVYTGTAVSELTEVAANGHAGGLCNNESELRFEASEGVTYMIALDGSPRYRYLFLGAEWVLFRDLTVELAGSGEGTVTSEPGGIECGLLCEANFVRQTLAYYWDGAARLAATPAPGSVFTGWSGDAECTDGPTVNPCAWLMAGEDATLVATFELEGEAPKGVPIEDEFEGGKGEGEKAGPPAPELIGDPGPPTAGQPPAAGPRKQPKCRKHHKKKGAKGAKPCKRTKPTTHR